MFEERIKTGDVVKESNRSYVHEDPTSHSRTVYDAKGEVTRVHNSAGQDITVTRDADGKPVMIQYTRDGKIESTFAHERTNGVDYWAEYDLQGTSKHKFHEVRVDADGSITKIKWTSDKGDDWTGTKERPDGLIVQIDNIGRETISAGELARERTRVEEMARVAFKDPVRQERFAKWMRDFEEVAAKRVPPLSPEEIANTYYQLDKLVSSENSIMSQSDRLQLAEYFIYKTSNPHTIGQGKFNTCNVTAEIEHRMITLHPAEALQLVTDVATTGKFITAKGDIIDMNSMNSVMNPFRVDENGFNPVSYGGRDMFDQLFQTASVETYWQTQSGDIDLGGVIMKGIRRTSNVVDIRAGNAFRPGDLRYEFTSDRVQSNSGEVINNYSTNPATRMPGPKASTMIDPLTGKEQTVVEWLPADMPNLTGKQMLDIGQQITGRLEPPHMLARPGVDKAAESVTSSSDLAVKLKKMKQDGGLPATVFVDVGDPLMSGGQSGSHVINVQNIFEKDNKWYVEFTNQWTSYYDHLGDNAVPVEDLYRAMEQRAPARANLP